MKKMNVLIAGAVAAGMAAGLAAAGDANKIVIDGSTTVGPIAKAFAEYFMGKYPAVTITVSESGSGNGAKSLINAACDIATMSRPMKDSEIEAARSAGVLPIEHIVAMDGLAVAVHPSNPVGALSIEQVRNIYMGKISNWKELGGPDMPIVVISRDTNSGTYEAFESLVMNKQKMTDKAEYVGSNGAVRQRVMSTAAAVGYVGLAFLEGVKPVKVEGIVPSPETVNDKTYPVSRPLYMYTNGRPKAGSPLTKFVALSATPEGMKMVEEIGFVPVK
jgi:phosphate transport system substrate-binding protein